SRRLPAARAPAPRRSRRSATAPSAGPPPRLRSLCTSRSGHGEAGIGSAAVPDVLIYADSLRSPEMRHEVPLAIPDAFLYAERDGSRHVVASSFELDRMKAVAPDLELMPYEEFGLDELYAQGLSRDEIELEVVLRAVRRFGIERTAVPSTFPPEVADHL